MSMFGNFGNTNPNPTNTTTGGGLFGAQNTNQGTAGSSLFGSTTNTNPNPLQAQPTQPALFGSMNTNPNPNPTGTTGGGLFGAFGGGNTTTTTNQPGATGTGLFGSQNPPAAGTSLFGGNTGTTGGTGGNLFGNAAQQTQTGLNNPLFGGPGPSTTTTGTGGGGLFGSTTTNPAGGGGLFGSSTNTQQAGTAGSNLFGSTQAGGSNLFGGAKPAGTGLFGSTTANVNPLFGGQQQQQQPQPSLFGSTPGNPLFGGGNKPSPFGMSSFGGPAQQTTGLGSSLAPTSNLLASRSTAGSQQQPADAQAQYVKLCQSMEGIYTAWNPASRDCRFQYNFYNLVDPKQVNLYGRPPNATNDALWEKAVRENPDPSCLVPVIAVGFDDLRARIDAQTAQSASHIQKLNDLQSRLSGLRTQHSVSNTSRLRRASTLQTQLTQRLMLLVQHLHLLIPAIRSSALRPEEEALRGKLEEMEEEMRRSRVKGRLNELWALIGAVSAGVERAGGVGTGAGEWAVVDEDGLAQIAQILADQQAGLQHLTKILQKCQKDLAVIMGNSSSAKSGSAEDAGYPLEGGENLWSSTSTLRASALR